MCLVIPGQVVERYHPATRWAALGTGTRDALQRGRVARIADLRRLCVAELTEEGCR